MANISDFGIHTRPQPNVTQAIDEGMWLAVLLS